MDEFILNRVFQPVAEWLEKLGVSYLLVAKIEMMFASVVLSFGLVGAVLYERWFNVLASTAAVIYVFAEIRGIESHKRKVDAGRMQPPLERATRIYIRVFYMASCVTLILFFTLSIILGSMDRFGAVIWGLYLVSLVTGSYLWVVFPPVPNARFGKLVYAAHELSAARNL